jgi:tripartite-type tricarboxylate transporter receptor subunit TctC
MAVSLSNIQTEAASVADFYRGKTVEVYVGVSAGGGYSTFAQILVNTLGKHIPGNPTVIVKHLTGAGGMKALNYVYNAAPKDGTVVITPNSGSTRRYVLGMSGPKYDPLKIHWMGGWGEAVFVLTVLNTAPVKTLQEAMEKEVILGAIGKNDVTYQNPTLMNNVLGTKFKVIPGYQGGARVRLAMEKGEVQGWCGQYMGWKSAKPEWIREGKLVHLVQIASKKHPEMPNVPQLTDFAKNDEQKKMFRFVQSGMEDRTFAAPPGVPADRLAALEKAYMDTLNDPEFKEQAAKKKYDVYPVTGQEVRDYIKEMISTPPEVLAKLKKAMDLQE